MIFMITLTVSALLILIAGLMEIKLPFIAKGSDVKSKTPPPPVKKPIDIKEKLVKDSVENTIRNSRFLKHKMNENIF
jgi:hypothetical protein